MGAAGRVVARPGEVPRRFSGLHPNGRGSAGPCAGRNRRPRQVALGRRRAACDPRVRAATWSARAHRRPRVRLPHRQPPCRPVRLEPAAGRTIGPAGSAHKGAGSARVPRGRGRRRARRASAADNLGPDAGAAPRPRRCRTRRRPSTAQPAGLRFVGAHAVFLPCGRGLPRYRSLHEPDAQRRPRRGAHTRCHEPGVRPMDRRAGSTARCQRSLSAHGQSRARRRTRTMPRQGDSRSRLVLSDRAHRRRQDAVIARLRARPRAPARQAARRLRHSLHQHHRTDRRRIPRRLQKSGAGGVSGAPQPGGVGPEGRNRSQPARLRKLGCAARRHHQCATVRVAVCRAHLALPQAAQPRRQRDRAGRSAATAARVHAADPRHPASARPALRRDHRAVYCHPARAVLHALLRPGREPPRPGRRCRDHRRPRCAVRATGARGGAPTRRSFGGDAVDDPGQRSRATRRRARRGQPPARCARPARAAACRRFSPFRADVRRPSQGRSRRGQAAPRRTARRNRPAAGSSREHSTDRGRCRCRLSGGLPCSCGTGFDCASRRPLQSRGPFAQRRWAGSGHRAPVRPTDGTAQRPAAQGRAGNPVGTARPPGHCARSQALRALLPAALLPMRSG